MVECRVGIASSIACSPLPLGNLVVLYGGVVGKRRRSGMASIGSSKGSYRPMVVGVRNGNGIGTSFVGSGDEGNVIGTVIGIGVGR